MMRSDWNFRALVEPTTRKYRVVYDRGKRQMQFFTEHEAETFAAANGGTVEPITARRFTLPPER